MASRGSVPDHQIVLAPFHQIEDIIEHILLLNPGGRADIIHKVVVEVGKGRYDLIDFRTESPPPHVQDDLRTNLDPVQVPNVLDPGLSVPYRGFEDIRQRRGGIAGNHQGLPSHIRKMQSQGSGAGRLPDTPFPTDHDELAVLFVQL